MEDTSRPSAAWAGCGLELQPSQTGVLVASAESSPGGLPVPVPDLRHWSRLKYFETRLDDI